MASEGRAPSLTFLGGAGTVTGSRFLVTTGRARVLVDCGLFQGEKELRLRNWEPFPLEPSRLDAVILTHAHLDHAGLLPRLVRDGFRGPAYASAATATLCGALLPDSGRIQEEDATYANEKGYSKHAPALPLYTEADAERALTHLRVLPFGVPTDLAEGVRGALFPSGHILGAAFVELAVDGPVPRRVVVSGDLGRPAHPLLAPPGPPPAADALLLESTYGDRAHPPAAALEESFAAAVSRTAERGGVCVIPAFAVDRTELVLHVLQGLVAARRIPDLPVFVDSPLALAALEIYRRAFLEGSEEVRPELRGRAPGFEQLRLRELRSIEQSRDVQVLPGPFVVVSASGMATGGRVLHHLRARLADARNSVLLVGYQARGTRGWRLLQGERALKLLGRYVPVAAEIVDLAGFSVHADAGELVAWAGRAAAPPGIVYAVHGEPAAADALARRITAELRIPAVVPRPGERVRL